METNLSSKKKASGSNDDFSAVKSGVVAAAASYGIQYCKLYVTGKVLRDSKYPNTKGIGDCQKSIYSWKGLDASERLYVQKVDCTKYKMGSQTQWMIDVYMDTDPESSQAGKSRIITYSPYGVRNISEGDKKSLMDIGRNDGTGGLIKMMDDDRVFYEDLCYSPEKKAAFIEAENNKRKVGGKEGPKSTQGLGIK